MQKEPPESGVANIAERRFQPAVHNGNILWQLPRSVNGNCTARNVAQTFSPADFGDTAPESAHPRAQQSRASGRRVVAACRQTAAFFSCFSFSGFLPCNHDPDSESGFVRRHSSQSLLVCLDLKRAPMAAPKNIPT